MVQHTKLLREEEEETGMERTRQSWIPIGTSAYNTNNAWFIKTTAFLLFNLFLSETGYVNLMSDRIRKN